MRQKSQQGRTAFEFFSSLAPVAFLIGCAGFGGDEFKDSSGQEQANQGQLIDSIPPVNPIIETELAEIHLVAKLPANGKFSILGARLSQQIGQPFSDETRRELEQIAVAYFIELGVQNHSVSVVATSQTGMRVRAVADDSAQNNPALLRSNQATLANAVRFDEWKHSPVRVLIAKDDRTLFFKKSDGQIIEFPVAVGQAKYATPNALYTVEAVAKNPTWYPPKSIRRDAEANGKPLPEFVPPGEKNPLGSWFIRLQDSIGIHGTNNPASIGRAASRGCVRMHNRHVNELAMQINKGDQVQVVTSVWSD